MRSAQPNINISWASKNQKVWIPLPPKEVTDVVYKRGVIVDIVDKETLKVKYDDGSKEPQNIRGDKIYPCMNYADHPNGYDDMIDMPNINEAEVLQNIQLRYEADQIFTYAGPTLISVNPNKYMYKLFEPKMIQKYQQAINMGKADLKDSPPHVFALAAISLVNIMNNQKNQAIVISGESGAGKTEIAKVTMKFLASLASNKKLDDKRFICIGRNGLEGGNKKVKSIEDQILACSPILEAFGNAKTVRNDNSSRFGKYVSLLVEKGGNKIIGATIVNYLLEKSRICSQNNDERNYHVFYALIKGQSEDELNKLFLKKNVNEYECLKNDLKGPFRGVSDVDLFKDIVQCFQTMGFSEEEQKVIWSYTAATLLLNNLKFDEGKKNDNTPCAFENEETAKNIATLLSLDYEAFAKSLLYKTRVISNEIIQSPVSKEECMTYRNSFAKELYNRLFNWLVRRLNFNVMPAEFMEKGANIKALMENYHYIGLLDIIGFEILEKNSLEQLFINYTNEKIQQLYIEYVFKGEEKEFIQEGLKDFLSQLTFKDNQAIIDMLDKVNPMGIFQMVDELSSVNSTDSLLAEKILKTFSRPGTPFSMPRVGKESFIVRHTAKDVEYNIEGFRAKNKDELPKVIEDNMHSSMFPEVVRVWKNLYPNEVDSDQQVGNKPNPRDKFLAYKFRMQMKELMEELERCECHFIRCLKPNEVKESGLFVPSLVLKQLSYMGILDTMKIRKENYPIRKPYHVFYQRYEELDPDVVSMDYNDHKAKGSDFKVLVKKICQKYLPENNNLVLFGATKVFMKSEAEEELEVIRAKMLKKKDDTATRVQKAWFRYKYTQIFRRMRRGIISIQKFFKVRDIYQSFQQIKRSAIKIQRFWRRILAIRAQEMMYAATVKLQAWWKMKVRRKKYLRTLAAARMINRVWRGALARKKAGARKFARDIIEEIVDRGTRLLYVKVESVAAVEIQRWVRGHLCRCWHYDKVLKIRKAKREYRSNKAAGVIQRYARGFLVRRTFKRLNRAAFYIQGFLKMKWLSIIFQQLRGASIVIQRAVKSWLARREAVNARLNEFLEAEELCYEASRKMERDVFFGFCNEKRQQDQYDSCLLENKRDGRDHVDRKKDSLLFSGYTNEDVLNNSQISNVARSIAAEQSMAYLDSTVNRQPATLYNFQGVNVTDGSLNKTREVTPYTPKKINLFIKVIDVEPLTDLTEVYEPLWGVQALQLQNECMNTDADLQIFEVGQAHSVAISNSNKVYAFGWNDCYQLGRPTPATGSGCSYSQVMFPAEGIRPKAAASGDDHTLLIDYQGNLYSWGNNSKGQLGLGHCRYLSKVSSVELPVNETAKDVRAKGNNSLVVTHSGKVFCWPFDLPTGEVVSRPVELSLPHKVQITTAACGHNFAVLVSKNGLVFTFGNENQAGQLGHGDLLPKDTPTLVETLKNEGVKVLAVSCGLKHVICKTALGKAYTWGWGEKGQLGHGILANELAPRLLSMTHALGNALGAKAKILQVEAGFKHSSVLLDNKKLLWFGSNSSLNNQAVPVEVNLSYKIPNMNNDFTPVRVLSAWSKSLNVTYVTIADTRALQLTPLIKQKILTTLASKIEETYSIRNGIQLRLYSLVYVLKVDPPFVDSIANYFPAKVMKDLLHKEKKPNKISPPKVKRPLVDKSLIKGNENYLEASMGSRVLENSGLYKGSHYSQRTENDYPKDENYTSNQKLPSVNIKNYDTFSAEQGQVKNQEPMEYSPSFHGKGEQQQHSPSEYESNAKSEEVSESSYTSNQIEQMSEKLRDIKRRMEEILRTPQDQWTRTDTEFMQIALEPKMYNLLRNVKI